MEPAPHSQLLITTRQTDTLDESTRQEVDRVCSAARPDEEYISLFNFLPPDGRHILGYLEDELTSHAVVTTRWLQPDGLPILKCAYVDAVSTVPHLQQQGYGSAVMKHLVTVLSDYQVAALQTERTAFYARVGWEEWQGPLAGRLTDGTLVPTPDMGADRIMIYRLAATPKLSLDTLLSIEYEGRMW